MWFTGVPCRDCQPRRCADGWQRLTAKPERPDRQEIVALELRGRVPFDCKFKIGAGHAVAVIGYPDQPAAAAIREHIDTPGARIERVLDQFFHDARGTFDDFTRGDTIDDGL